MFSVLFDNIGKKIKTLAKVTCVVGAIISFIYAMILFVGGFFGTGLLVLILGMLASWIGTFVLYAFGEMVEDVHEMKRKFSENADKTQAE